MRGEKVVALPGFAVPTPIGEPVKAVVDIMRDYLDRAESGQLRAVALAGVMVTDTASPNIETDFAAPQHAWALNAAIGRLTLRFHQSIYE